MLLTWLPAWLSKMQCAPSADRNKAPIAAVLAKYEPFAGSKPASLLEVASGTGQHAAHLATAFPHVVWQPTEFAGGSAGPESPAYGDLAPVFASIVAYTSGMANVRPPLALDASASPWPAPIESATFDAIFACNVLHISPYAVTEGLLAGAARRLVPGSGLLCVYGPFMVDGEHTSDSNAAFSARLQAQNSAWAVRDATAIAETARAQHLPEPEPEPEPNPNPSPNPSPSPSPNPNPHQASYIATGREMLSDRTDFTEIFKRY